MKNSKQMERHFKGISNHKRIDILLALDKESGLNLDEINEYLKGNLKTTSEHTRRLVQAGLLNKNYKGRNVLHSLSPYGKNFVKFIKTFQHS
ncbi:ArsR family transcriptional regulator [Patescibacteria group bacterium]|nr:ArsR family transcriptional regulator [Patescibacteria group bacterium]MCG2695301.1 ArsR family transcriptional regulator [Candidatus Parcubacteria bacterium]